MFGEEQLSPEHMSHELWHDLRPYIAPAIAATVGAVALFCRKQIRSWFNKEKPDE